MGIKLKSNSIFKTLNAVVLLLIVVLLPIQISKTIDSYSSEKNIYDRVEVRSYLLDFDYRTAFKNNYISADGTPRAELVENEVLENKLEQESLFNKSKEYIESQTYNSDENINKAETGRLIEESRLRIMISEEEIREKYMRELEKEFKDIKESLFNNNRNIEFYCENPETGFVITNVPGSKVEDFIINEEDEEYEYLNITKANGGFKSNKVATENLKSIADYTYGWSSEKGYNRYYKIPKKLLPGDLLYDVQEEQENIIAKYNRNLILSVVMGVVFLLLLIVAYRSRGKDGNKLLDKYYKVVPIEVKIISPLIAIANIFIINWDMVIYARRLLYIRIPFQIILLIISYKFISEIITEGGTKIDYENMKKRSVFYNLKILIIKFINLVKGSFLVKSTKIRVVTVIGMTMLFYISLSFWGKGMSAALPYKILVTIIPLIYPAVMIIYILNIAKGLNLLKISTDKIVEGNYNVDIDVKGPLIIKEITYNIKNIEEGLSIAIDEAVTSEKLKGELITNVSHDLKTPLTSIISYIDLLKNYNLKEEDRKKYINVLDGKAQRLKVLIEDLFEASKASSGSLEIQKENIDVSSLLRQTLGEFQEKISTSSLEFINKWPEEKSELYLDGKKTWRVFENLISNILKYSMENSRVYIEVIKNNDNVQIIMKNMSAYQLDFTEEEVIERFKRGDKSRHTEGSGLGLAIAKSLVELQGGNFKIEIDGDLFKVILTFTSSDIEI